jgi:hypothetical protein
MTLPLLSKILVRVGGTRCENKGKYWSASLLSFDQVIPAATAPNTTQAAATNKILLNQPTLPLFLAPETSLALLLTAISEVVPLEAVSFETVILVDALFEAVPLELVLFDLLLLEVDFLDVFFALKLFGASYSLLSDFLRRLPFFDDFLELFLTIYFKINPFFYFSKEGSQFQTLTKLYLFRPSRLDL